MTERKEMDVIESLRKISRELISIDPDNLEEFMQMVAGASFMINWIADGLEREINFAANRGARDIAQLALGEGENSGLSKTS